MKLTLDAPSPEGAWTLHLDNAGAVPLHVLADARLLAFEIALPDDDDDDGPRRRKRPARPIVCKLPGDMRPRDTGERALVIPAGRGYVEKLDPRLFCFGAREAAALVPGATITPRLEGSRELSAVEPIDDVEPRIGTLRDLTGSIATIGPVPTLVAAKDAGIVNPVAVSSARFADAQLGWQAEIPVTVTNASSKGVTLFFRPETLAFDVTGPSGIGVTDPSPTVHCSWTRSPPPPITETYAHLAPRGSSSIVVLLDAMCPDNALQRPGLYIVRATLDTRRESGASIGVPSFTGSVLATGTTRLRVRESAGPAPAASRPQLADIPRTPQ